MTDTTALVPDIDSQLVPTPNEDDLPYRRSDFATFGDALDYAAKGKKGFNFHDPRGKLIRPYPFSELREDALAMAYRLIAHGVKPGDRIALIAETGPDFAALFCGAVYAGAWPAGTGVLLAEAATCATATAEGVGQVLTAADQLTFFREGDVVYQVFAAGMLPGDAEC